MTPIVNVTAVLGAAVTGIMMLYLFVLLFGRELLDAMHAYENREDDGVRRLLALSLGALASIGAGMWSGWTALGG